tara:strand:- start:1851 stop:7376 length:5526 start_codon:yes stop_codon:yes gene_type:complete
MPEIKKQFTGGKMNKDVDERLVPSGEYRDAMNIQVSTSEGSDVGTVQNILGNSLVNTITYLTKNARCVGAISDEKNDSFYWFVTDSFENTKGGSGVVDRILLFNDGIIAPIFVDTTQRVLKFTRKEVTGINIIDDMLFWTDGVNEPRKINITRSREGTLSSGLNHTRLINDAQGINYSSAVPIEEKHITVIKAAPSMPPTLKSKTTYKEGSVNNSAQDLNFSNLAASNPQLLDEDQEINSVTITAGGFLGVNLNSNGVPIPPPTTAPNIQVGDVLLFQEEGFNAYPPENYQVRARVLDINSTTGLEINIRIQLISVSPNTPIVATNFNVVVEEEGYDLFSRKFPRFATRYKYEDGEYSAIGPFTEVVFIPGSFNYHPTEAYNKGMVNNLKSLELKDFTSSDMPKDVVQVDLLYKDEKSPEIYVVKSIDPSDDAWSAEGSYAGLLGSYKITTENIRAVVASNQGLRPWDNVPRAALAQEVSGNRIVYGNYLQGYNLDVNPSVKASILPRNSGDLFVAAKKSIKSLRTYNIGIVYGDEYGRETPVFTDKDSNQIVDKSLADKSNAFKVDVDSLHPSWARYYKFFVKETSNEYYNLALGRVYDAADGNIWLSFPSIDRNKVDEDTYLILKKGLNGDVVEQEARYKIVAIENEAPDYIKTSFTQLTKPNKYINVSTKDVFGGEGSNVAKEPTVGSMSFYIDKTIWVGDASIAGKFGQPDLEKQWSDRGSAELYVSVVGDLLDAAASSKRYLITDVITITAESAQSTDKEVFEVFISSPILEVDSWISTTLNSSGATIDISETTHRPIIHKKEVLQKPEFDGRFFVKINDTEVSRKYLKNDFKQDVNWQVIASADILWLRDGASKDYVDGAMAPVGNDLDLAGEVGGTTGNTRSGQGESGRGDFEQLLSANTGKWFIDQVAYAGTQSSATGNYSQIQTNSTLSDTTSNQVYFHEDPPIVLNISGGGSTEGPYGTGFSKAQIFGRGMQRDEMNPSDNYANDRRHRLTLSYSGISPNNGYGGSEWGLPNNYWELGTGTGEPAQEDFVNNIKEGSKFRMSADPDKTYTITSFTKKRIYNYRAFIPEPYVTGGHDSHGNNSWSKGNWYIDLGRASNRRLQFTIEYTIDGGNLSDDLRNNDAIPLINATTSGELQFITPFDSDAPVPISRFPAIFETEPKEDLDLDIYYEASGRIPTSFSDGDGALLIPPGSTLRVPDGFTDAGFTVNITASSWGNYNSQGNYTNNILNFSPSISSFEWAVLSYYFPTEPFTLQFDTPTGSVSYVEFNELNPEPLIAADGGYSQTGSYNGFVVEPSGKNDLNWFNCWSFGNGVESNRIGDTFNKPYLSNGAKVSTTLDKKYEEENRKYGLIYSGLYNSKSGVNNLNQFIAAEKITKDINPIYGSIQKLHSGWGQGGDLITLCEDRILKILANKDALFNADGNSNVTSTNNVLGQAIPYSGEYGISKNPESFASEAYRAYFTDKVRGTVMRLSMDGLTAISNHGMKDWFRDNLKISSTIKGSYDDKKDEYNVTLIKPQSPLPEFQAIGVDYSNNETVSFREDVKGWVSFKSFVPEKAISCANEYYTFKEGRPWLHHVTSSPRNTFYEKYIDSSFNFILNDAPGTVKSFTTLNYEGSKSRITPLLNESEVLISDGEYYNLEPRDGWYAYSVETDLDKGQVPEFVNRENKWFSYFQGKANTINFANYTVTDLDESSFSSQGLGVLNTEPSSVDNGLYIQLNFSSVNSSLQVGDLVFYININNSLVGGFTQSVNQQKLLFGEVAAVGETFINVIHDNFNNPNPIPSVGSYIMFAKDNSINTSNLKGYYADVGFRNNSTEKAELFSVGSQVVESSK